MKLPYFLAVVAAFVFAPALALAADAATSATSYTIDLSPILNEVLTGLGALVSIVATWALTQAGVWLKNKTGIDALGKDSAIRKTVDEALNNGIQFAIQKAENVDWTKIETRDKLIADSAAYVIRTVPDALAHFGITQQHLQDLLLARLHNYDEAPGTWTK